MKKSVLRLFAILMVAVMILSACSASNPTTTTESKTEAAPEQASANTEPVTTEKTEEKKEVRTVANIAVNRNITSLDGSGGGFTSTNASMQIYDPLVRIDANLGVQPALALSWEMVDDLTWKFSLRQGVKFQDGSDFNAETVAFSIDHYTNAIKYKYLTQWGQAWPPVCEIVDNYTVLLKTAAPQPAVPRLLSRLPMLPLNYAGMSQEDFFKAPVGTGPYKVAKWDQGICLTLEANENYWDGAPQIKTLNYYTVTDDNARLAGFKTGEYDIAFGIPYDQVESINAMDGRHVMQADTIGYDAIQYNFNVREGSPVANIKIREAMLYAVDHAGICSVIMCGYQQPAVGPAPLSVFGSYDGGGFPARDLDKAKALLKEAGYNNEEIIFAFHSGEFTSDLEVSELIVAQLQEAGLNVKFNQVESGAWTDMKATDQWDVTNNSVPGSFSGEAQYHYNQMKNLTGLNLPEFEEILNAADNDTKQSAEERAKDISAAMKVLWDYIPYVFGTVPVSSIGMTDDFIGYEYIPLNWLMMAKASFNG